MPEYLTLSALEASKNSPDMDGTAQVVQQAIEEIAKELNSPVNSVHVYRYSSDSDALKIDVTYDSGDFEIDYENRGGFAQTLNMMVYADPEYVSFGGDRWTFMEDEERPMSREEIIQQWREDEFEHEEYPSNENDGDGKPLPPIKYFDDCGNRLVERFCVNIVDAQEIIEQLSSYMRDGSVLREKMDQAYAEKDVAAQKAEVSTLMDQFRRASPEAQAMFRAELSKQKPESTEDTPSPA